MATDTDYSGHYDLADAKSDRVFSLDIQQNGQQVTVSFFITPINDAGPIPSAKGKGNVEDGYLAFDFKDNFNNEGTCTLESGPDGCHIEMTLTNLADARVAHFYGNYRLKKTRGGNAVQPKTAVKHTAH